MKPPLQLWLRRGLRCIFVSSKGYIFWGLCPLGAMSFERYPKFAVPGSVVPNPMPVESFRSTRCGAKRHQ